MQIARMRTFLVLCSLLICAMSTPARATVPLKLHFEWNYDISLPGLAGYILYQNGQRLLTINDPTTLTIDYTVEVEPGQTVVFTMTVFDVNGKESALSTPYSIVVPVVQGNLLPTATLNLANGSGPAPLVVDFFAVGSTDLDGTIVSYGWDFGDGASGSTSTVSHTYTIAGVYTVTLTVTDNAGGVGTAQRTVTVSAPPANIPPTALFYLTQASGTAPLVVGFDGTSSTDDGGSITSYVWNFGDGWLATGSNVSHVYTTAGSFTAKLTVTDNEGAQATHEELIVVKAGSVDLISSVVSISFNPRFPTIKDFVQFSGAASIVPVGNITRYLWNFGDGKSASGVTASHQYGIPGSYTVKLTVWDNYGASSQRMVVLTIQSLESRAKELSIQSVQNAIHLLLLKKSEK